MTRLVKTGATNEAVKGLAGPAANPTAPSDSKKKKKKRKKKKTKEEEEKEVFLVNQWKYYCKKGELRDFRRLCVDLGLPGDLDTKKKCRKEIKNLHVNIVQFLESEKRPGDVKFFKDRDALVKYTKNGAVFPRHRLPDGDPLKAMLKHIFGYLV
ncbi:hypothetical protein ACHAPT_010009 [Fusarium lateritium]